MGYAIYCRISRDTEGEGTGVDRQQAECELFAADNNLPVDKIYRDNDISAFSGDNRPEYRAMVEKLQAGAYEGVIVMHVDRLYRRIADLEELVDLVEKTKITIRTVQAGEIDLNTATGRVVARLVAALGSYEVEHLIERVLVSQRARAVEGKYRGGKPPYGYKLGDTPGTLEIDEDAARIVRELARRVLAGEHLLAIAKDLNNRGVPTQSGKKWGTSNIRRTLRKPSVAGLSVHHGVIVGKAQWDAIIEEDEWRAIDAILGDPSRRTQQGNLKKWQGAGVYECGRCGGKMVTRKSSNPSGSGRHYECGKCHRVARNLDLVDETVNAVVLGYLDLPDNRLKLAAAQEGEDGELTTLMERRRHLDQRRVRLGALFADGAIDEDQLVAGTNDLKRDIGRIDDRLVAIRMTSPAAELVLAGDDIAQRWADMSPDNRGEVIDELMTVTIMPAGKGRWKFDPSLIKIEWK